MRSREEDNLRRQQAVTLERHMRLLERQNRTLEQLAETLRHPPRAGEQGPASRWRTRRPLTSLWQTLVPDSHVIETADREGCRQRIVLCPCGAQTVLGAKGHQGCDGIRWHGDVVDPEGCDRWFLIRPLEVYVHRFMAASQLTAV